VRFTLCRERTIFFLPSLPMKKPHNKKPPIYRANRSPSGWWLASYIVRFEYHDEDKSNLNRRCLAWKNTIILKAKNREEAFRKANKSGKLSNSQQFWSENNGRKGQVVFEGITNLLPIYEELDDGAEILWTEYKGRSVKKVKSWVKAKTDLEAFDDKETAANH
jgi:hypothetical protein